jgi:1,6-anhydro-N-acetylmuramate kinase
VAHGTRRGFLLGQLVRSASAARACSISSRASLEVQQRVGRSDALCPEVQTVLLSLHSIWSGGSPGQTVRVSRRMEQQVTFPWRPGAVSTLHSVVCITHHGAHRRRTFPWRPGAVLYTPLDGMYHAPRCTPASNIPMAPGSSSLHSIRWYVSRTTVHTGVEKRALPTPARCTATQQNANREIRVWHFVEENGY